MGAYLASHRVKHGELTVLARLSGKSVRTLHNWKRRGGQSGRPGRPAHSVEEKLAARLSIEPVWRALLPGHDGWRTVKTCLLRDGIKRPTRLVQDIVRELKAERAARKQQRIEEQRTHVEVLVRDAMWSSDQTHLGRDADGEIKGLAVRDALCSRSLALSVGPPACAADVVRLLEHAAEVRGTWPLLLSLDNGSENKNALLEERLRREHVIVLWNEPHTPQHNARAERTIGDLKRASGLAVCVNADADPMRVPVACSEPGVLATRESVYMRLRAAWRTLDEQTPRASLGGLTPIELDRIAPRAEDRVCRDRFYRELCLELERIALEPGTKRARRKMEREAIWRALERFGLVKRTRGGRPSRPSKRKE